MNTSKIYLNNFYLYFLSFKYEIKNKTTFKYLVSAITSGKINLCYLLIKLIKYLMKFNLSKFEINLFDINIFLMGIGDWGLGIGDWGLGPIPKPQSPIPQPQSPHPKYR